MKKQLILILISIFLIDYSYGQISIGEIEKEKATIEIYKAPIYDSLEGFLDYGEFYRYNPYNEIPRNERPTEQEFYKRYIDLKIYYPMFSNDYRTDETIIFKKADSIQSLNRMDLGEKYFTIISIQSSFEESTFYGDVKSSSIIIPFALTDALLFELREEKSNKTVYVVESSYNPTFILTPFYSKASQLIKENVFVARKYFSGTKVPLSEEVVAVEKDSEWTGALTLLRKKNLWREFDDDSPDAQDIKYIVILNNDSDTILVYLDKDDHYQYLQAMFVTKKFNNQQKQQARNEQKKRLNDLNKKYGEKYGNLIYHNKVSIGMTMEMCQLAWGSTLNRKKYTDASEEIEIWKYIGLGKLFFKNGELNNIIRY